MIRIVGLTLAAALVAPAASAEQYWIAYEGNDFPEEVGWERNWGDWEGQYHGGAYRSLEGGVLTIDSLHDDGVFDFAFIEMPGQIDPEAGELFVMEWGLKIDEVVGYWDPVVALRSDGKWAVGLEFDESTVTSAFEDGVWAAFSPGVFHDYRLTSSDMLTYQLHVDGQLTLEGSFWLSASESYVAWGDGVQGAASLTHWDYFRFGVVPQPQALSIVLVWAAVFGGRQR